MKRSISHATFTIEKTYNASPERVFKAFADPVAKTKWFGAPEGWSENKYSLDFRVGGLEISEGRSPGGPMHYYEARHQDIVPNQRIITTYAMRLDDTKISVSVATVEFEPSGKGTKLTFTEMGAYLDGHDPKGEMRREGTSQMLDNVVKALAD
jgi:uncharacterized protein YndB with AHSA1/START domain